MNITKIEYIEGSRKTRTMVEYSHTDEETGAVMRRLFETNEEPSPDFVKAVNDIASTAAWASEVEPQGLTVRKIRFRNGAVSVEYLRESARSEKPMKLKSPEIPEDSFPQTEMKRILTLKKRAESFVIGQELAQQELFNNG